MIPRAVKRICAILLLISVLCFAFGCKSSVQNGDLFEQLLAESGESEVYKPYASKVYIVIPQNASAELSLSARSLADLITEKTSVQTVLKYDNEPIAVGEGELEILIGNTSRLASSEAVGRLRLGEYICRWDKGNIILGGRYEQATLNAIEKFVSDVLYSASPYSLMGSDVSLEHREEYEFSTVTLNGYELYDYTLVYAENGTSSERDIAEGIRAYVSARSGYLLDIIAASSVGEATGKIISLGDLYASEQSKSLYDCGIEKVEQGISIFGKDSYALSVAAAEFAKRLFEAKSTNEAKAEFLGVSGFSASMSELNVCSATVRNDGSWGEEYSSGLLEGIGSAFGKYDLLIFREIDPYILENDFIPSLPVGYTCKSLDGGAAVIYNGALLEKIECSVADSVINLTLQKKGSAEIFRLIDAGDKNIGELTDAQTYDAVISSAELDIASFGFSCVGNDKCSLKGDSYSAYFYVDSATVSAKEYESEKFDGQHFAKLFFAMTLKTKYAPSFCELTNAFE